ncbi:MAG: Superoxide dismutase [Microgenomates group bacterium GW2011_GWC1_39_7b]|uniref:Superoxide dismutase n=2 Tax=Candidatus Woeseibacteriota TaxID=1752722 RepID=A0A0G0LKY5_9BACT|nr:MAG: Superoxide dismutase [Candidatus Woesebacteria bacterium GW2011_GWB1_39_10]KKR26729.1 MAG: Superoxide dismutase [Microgenomates group bacterium GW2011_GWC1_39_7b]KKS90684.1 MAG: Superoxide dismutase [Candidatus Woesebacteria bacterium GW2011_GWA1_43_12]
MFILPDLPYAYEALEPFVDEETMHIHHDKHHASYVKNLNDLLAGHDDLLNMDINELLKNLDKVPEEIRQKVKNNAGGVANHNMFWEIMEPNPNSEIRNPKQNLMIQIQKDFGNFDTFKEKFSAVALGHFGSGWAWVVVNDGKLEISDSSNQDSTISYSLSPILCLDVWEHAYYLKYKNMRAEYIAAFWSIVNWKEVERRFGEVSRI